MDPSSVTVISESFIKPKYVVEESKKPFYLGSFELFPLSLSYIQIGLAFDKLPSVEDAGMDSFVEKLKTSLSSTLVHYYPLAGRLATKVDEDKHNSTIYIDCNKGSGVKLIHASLKQVGMNDVLSPTIVPDIVQSFYELGRVPTNYDGHVEPLLSVQVTELVDGLFLGVSVNHSVMDGTLFWQFLSMWSEVFQSNSVSISRPPLLERWFPEGHGPLIRIPYIHRDEFITEYKTKNDGLLKQAVLHFTDESVLALKEKANKDLGTIDKISSTQALAALLWRAITRSRGSRCNTKTTLVLMANARSRLCPPLPPHYFGNFIQPIISSENVEELLGKPLGFVALLLHQGVQELTDQVIRDEFTRFVKSPFVSINGKSDPNEILIGGYSKVDMSKFEFGSVGKPVAIRSGSNKYDGKVMLRPEKEGRRSTSVEVCLLPNIMTTFEQDPELMSFLA